MSVSRITPSPNSTRPYLIRALYEWCTDNGYTPYIAAYAGESVQVPREYVKNNEIVLNISMDATSSLKLGNEFIEFKARFAGSAREIMVPIDHVLAIYARENGQGMAFPVPQSVSVRGEVTQPEQPPPVSSVPAGINLPVTPKIVHLVSVDDASANMASSTSTDPPKPPSGPRPALKRVK